MDAMASEQTTMETTVEPLAVWAIPPNVDPRDAVGAGLALLRSASAELRAAALAAAWRARLTGEDAAVLLCERELLGPLAVRDESMRCRSRFHDRAGECP